MKRILLSLAHPDDESFIVGGTVARYVRDGWTVNLLVATSGEAGKMGEHTWAADGGLAELRRHETERAANVLGISDVTFLEYRDGNLSGLPAGEYEDKLYGIMVAQLPDIVLTFDTTGFSNHPDHIKTSYATTFAFQKYAAHLAQVADPTYQMPGRGREWREEESRRSFAEVGVSTEPKLYYACIPESVASYMKRVGAHEEESYGRPWNGTPDEKVTTDIDIRETADAKSRALMAHETQREDVEKYIAGGSANPFLNHEYFLLRMQGVYEVFMGKTDRMATAL
jgi:LmbE family N-acetylglucosaminyl deacetylase